jgi:very-short-patch-repair endonuclease
LPDVKQYDKQREDYIKELGLQVIRFKNEDVFFNPHLIEEKLSDLIPNPSPTSRRE